MKLTTIYEGSLFECQVIKNLLENEGIQSVLNDEAIGSRGHAWVPTETVKVIVSEKDIIASIKIVEEFKNSRKV